MSFRYVNFAKIWITDAQRGFVCGDAARATVRQSRRKLVQADMVFRTAHIRDLHKH